MRDVVVYLDGRNIFYSLTQVGVDPYNFNYRAFLETLLKGRNIRAIKYYGARYPRKLDQTKHNRDEVLFQELAADGIKVILGNCKINDDNKTAREKGVDVRLAVDLVVDAIYNNYEDAYVVSSDTDIIPAITEAKKLPGRARKIYGVSICRAALQEFRDKCDGIVPVYPDQVKDFVTKKPPAESSLNDLQDKFSKAQNNSNRAKK